MGGQGSMPITWGSGVGTVVDVYGPGVDVQIRSDSLAQVLPVDGTSPATAILAGIAGLLKAFDPAQMNIVPVPSPLNDRVYFAVNRYSSPVISQTDWAPGPNATPIGNEWSYQERYINRNSVSLDTELWSVPWAGGSAQMHWGRGGKTITWFGLAESSGSTGHEAVMAIGTIDALAAGPFVGGFVQCDIEYLMIAQQTPTESPRSAPPTTCDVGGIEIPQIAPFKVGPRGFDPLQRPIPRIR
jgi:hypothetical protein